MADANAIAALLLVGAIIFDYNGDQKKLKYEAEIKREAEMREAVERAQREEIEKEKQKQIAAEQARLAEEAEKKRRIEQAAREAKWIKERRIWIGMSKEQLLKSQGVPLSVVMSDSVWTEYIELLTFPRLLATVRDGVLVDYTLYSD